MSEEDGRTPADWIRAAVERFQGPLLRYALRITGDLEAGRDVVQDTFLRLCREEPKRVDGHLAEWLFTVCRHRALDVRRKEKRMTAMGQQDVVGEANRERSHEATIEDRDTFARVRSIVDRLPEQQQDVIRLRFQESLSYKEIGGVTGLSVSHVGFLLHTAIQRIRQEMGSTSDV